MKEAIEFISQPWPWYVAGPIISFVMFFFMYFGNRFGISSSFRTLCSMMGAGKTCDFFDYDWRIDKWRIFFVIGLIGGGFIAHFLMTPEGQTVAIAQATVQELRGYGIVNPGEELIPKEIFSWSSLQTPRGIIMMVLGGFMVGFGTRYAGGCTSGHAISGLSELQLVSLIAVAGFFIGGLAFTYFVLPFVLTL